MRLPWPLGRRSPSEGPSSASPAGGAADAPAAQRLADDHAASASREAPPTGAWRTLPPIQRASGPVPVVAPARPFLARVPGATPLPTIVG
ncbi:MAG: hypothetical protein WCK58_15495, partial [Chloroflexota bacterium]